MTNDNQTEVARPVRWSAWLGINIVTLILIVIVAIGQWQIYPRLNAMEAKIESLAMQQSQQKSLRRAQSKMPESPSNASGDKKSPPEL